MPEFVVLIVRIILGLVFILGLVLFYVGFTHQNYPNSRFAAFRERVLKFVCILRLINSNREDALDRAADGLALFMLFYSLLALLFVLFA